MVAHQTVPDERLLRAVVEQIKLPLLQIARQAETISENQEATLSVITETANTALQLLDSYLLSADLHAQKSLQLEPVLITSILHDTAAQLTERARQYDCDLEVHVGNSYQPIMGNRQALQSAFFALGCALIESQQADQSKRIILAARRTQTGISAGVYSQQAKVSADVFRRARALYGTTRQPLPSVSPSASAGVFVADALLSALASPLRVAHHQKLSGLSTILLPSQQLQLV